MSDDGGVDDQSQRIEFLVLCWGRREVQLEFNESNVLIVMTLNPPSVALSVGLPVGKLCFDRLVNRVDRLN